MLWLTVFGNHMRPSSYFTVTFQAPARYELECPDSTSLNRRAYCDTIQSNYSIICNIRFAQTRKSFMSWYLWSSDCCLGVHVSSLDDETWCEKTWDASSWNVALQKMTTGGHYFCEACSKRWNSILLYICCYFEPDSLLTKEKNPVLKIVTWNRSSQFLQDWIPSPRAGKQDVSHTLTDIHIRT